MIGWWEDERLTLLFHAAVPPEVYTDNLGRHRQVESDAAGLEGCDHDLASLVFFEVDERFVTFDLIHPTIELPPFVSRVSKPPCRPLCRYLDEAPFFFGEHLSEDVHPGHVNSRPLPSSITATTYKV